MGFSHTRRRGAARVIAMHAVGQRDVHRVEQPRAACLVVLVVTPEILNAVQALQLGPFLRIVADDGGKLRVLLCVDERRQNRVLRDVTCPDNGISNASARRRAA
jgi:hypothetical protein